MARSIGGRGSGRPGRSIAAIALAAALCLAAGTGCVTGLVYEHTTRPLDLNLQNDPARLDDDRGEARGDSVKRLVIPTVVGPALEFDWGDASIATALRDAGITRVHYADLEKRSILRIWTEYWVHVHGE